MPVQAVHSSALKARSSSASPAGPAKLRVAIQCRTKAFAEAREVPFASAGIAGGVGDGEALTEGGADGSSPSAGEGAGFDWQAASSPAATTEEMPAPTLLRDPARDPSI